MNTIFNSQPQEITVKEVYEKVVKLEAQLDLMKDINNRTRIQFRFFVYVIVLIELINLMFNLYMVLT